MTKLPNIIFLDMDGVLCNPRACLATGNTEGVFTYLDPIACLLVKKLCDECDARLVISSSWRILHDQYSMQAVLNAACPNLGNKMFFDAKWRTVSGVVSNEENFDDGRGWEIKQWLDTHSSEFNNFVILDDDSDMEPLMSSFVKCDCYDGIGFHQYRAAKRLLMKGYSTTEEE